MADKMTHKVRAELALRMIRSALRAGGDITYFV